ncbi:hypothetical protein Q3C01_28085 [Bradyrhizobium sp. UFLA05-109]
MQAVVRAANITLYIGNIVKALIWLGFGGLLVGFAIRLVWPDGGSWFWDILAAIIGCQGLALMGSGLEQFVAANTKRQQQKHPQPSQHMLPTRREDRARSRADRYVS